MRGGRELLIAGCKKRLPRQSGTQARQSMPATQENIIVAADAMYRNDYAFIYATIHAKQNASSASHLFCFKISTTRHGCLLQYRIKRHEVNLPTFSAKRSQLYLPLSTFYRLRHRFRAR